MQQTSWQADSIRWESSSGHGIRCRAAIPEAGRSLTACSTSDRSTGLPRKAQDPDSVRSPMMHADTVMENSSVLDGSVCHIVEFDPETGVMVKSHGGQGYAEGSSWTRGQGWALYGVCQQLYPYRQTGISGYRQKSSTLLHRQHPGEWYYSRRLPSAHAPAWEDSCGCMYHCRVVS